MSNTIGSIQAIEQFKDQYIGAQGKNTFFKKNQKLDSAKAVCEKFDLSDMIKQTVYIIPNTNRIIINYTVFKLYAYPEIYDTLVTYLIFMYETVLQNYQSFELHIILDTFTISAAERYKGVIKLVCDKCNVPTNYSLLLSQMYIYYTPSMIDSITTLLKPFMDDSLTSKITMYSKTESPILLKSLIEST
jgi:hypothetical protein